MNTKEPKKSMGRKKSWGSSRKTGKHSLNNRRLRFASLKNRTEFKKQKKLSAQMKGGLLTDVEMQETPTITENLTSMDQTSSVISDSVHKSTQDDDIEVSSAESEEHVLSPKKSTQQVAYGPITYSRSLRRIKPTQKVACRPGTYSRFFRKIKSKENEEFGRSFQKLSTDTNYTINSSVTLAAPACPTSVSSANSSVKMPLSKTPTALISVPVPENNSEPIVSVSNNAINTTTSTSSTSKVELTQPLQVSENKQPYIGLVTLPTATTTTSTDEEETLIKRRRKLNNERQKKCKAKQQVQPLEAYKTKLRKKMQKQAKLKQNVDAASHRSAREHEDDFECHDSRALSTNIPTVIKIVTPTVVMPRIASQICPAVPTKLEMGKRKLESDNSLFSKGILKQSACLLNEKEKAFRKFDAVLMKDSQGRNVLVLRSRQDTAGNSDLHKVSQNINPNSSSLPIVIRNIQESSNSFQDSNITIASQQNQPSVKSFQKTYDVIKDTSTSLEIVNTAKDCSTSASTVSHNSYTEPLVSNINTMQKLSNSAQSSVATGKVPESSLFVDIIKETSQPLPAFYVSQKESLKKVLKETKMSGRSIVEFDYVFKMLKIVNQHSESGCNLNNIIITRERKVGLKTYYTLKCTLCDYKINLCSENPTLEDNINADAIKGMLSINSNLDDMNELFSNMKLSPIPENVFIKEYDKKERISTKENPPTIHSKSSENFGKSLQERPQDAAFQVSTFHKKRYSKTAKESRENLTQKSKSFDNLMSDSSGLDKTFEQVLSNRVLEAEKRIESECRDKFEMTLSQHILKVPNNKPVGVEDDTLLNTTRIKQVIDLDMYEKELDKPESNKEEMLNNNNLGYNDQLKEMLSHQKQVRTCNNNLVVDKGEIRLFKTLVMQEIQDDSNFLKSGDIDTECGDNSEVILPHSILKVPNNKRVSVEDHTLLNTTRIKQEIDLDMYEEKLDKRENNNEEMLDNNNLGYNDQLKGMLSHQKQIEACNNKLVVDKGEIKLFKTLVKQEIQDDNSFLDPGDIETAYRKSMIEFDQLLAELCSNKR